MKTNPARLLMAASLLSTELAHAQFSITTNNGAITITGYTGTKASVIIPDTTNGFPVATIGNFAFYANQVITNVSLPATVTNIGTYAFAVCTKLETSTLPPNLISLGDESFEGCDSLTSVYIPASLASYGPGSFAADNALTNISVAANNPFFSSSNGIMYDAAAQTLIQYPSGIRLNYEIPSSVTTLATYCMWGVSLANLVIPGTVTNIESEAVVNNLNLTNLVLSNGIIAIGSNAFAGCEFLHNVRIPASVSIMGYAPFQGCLYQTNFAVEPANTNFASAGGVLFDSSFANLIEYPGGLFGTYAIPASVTNVNTAAFASCIKISGVAVPGTAYYIGTGAFENCTNLACASLANGLAYLGDYAFANCAKLSAVSIPPTVTYLGAGTFGLTAITNITIPAGITSLQLDAFIECPNLTTVVIPASVAVIDDNAFAGCPNLAALYFTGSPPSYLLGAFTSDVNAVAYYLPSAIGWEFTYDGLATKTWTLQLIHPGLYYGPQSNSFGFTITGGTNITAIIQGSTDLSALEWAPLQTNVLTGGQAFFSDPQWVNFPNRIYRAVISE